MQSSARSIPPFFILKARRTFMQTFQLIIKFNRLSMFQISFVAPLLTPEHHKHHYFFTSLFLFFVSVSIISQPSSSRFNDARVSLLPCP